MVQKVWRVRVDERTPRVGLNGSVDGVTVAYASHGLTMCSDVRTKRATSPLRLRRGKGPLPQQPQALLRQVPQAAFSHPPRRNQPLHTGTMATKQITFSVEPSIICCHSTFRLPRPPIPLIFCGIEVLRELCPRAMPIALSNVFMKRSHLSRMLFSEGI